MTANQRGMIVLGSALTDVGRARNRNEDRVHFWAHADVSLAVVADGMGGAAAGEEASRIVIDTVQARLPVEFVLQNQATLTERDLRLTVQAANHNILQHALQHPALKGMGTTVTLALVRGGSVMVAHVGDSRAYHISPEGTITQITTDHSFVQALLDAKHITEEQAETHPMGHILYRALGQTKDLKVDTYSMRLHPHDHLLLCSDGLTRHVRRHEIAQLTSQSTETNSIAQNLIALANMRGGTDNISVIVLYLDETASTPQHSADQLEQQTNVTHDVSTAHLEAEDAPGHVPTDDLARQIDSNPKA